MKETKIYCDICGMEIKSGYGVDRGTLRLTGILKNDEHGENNPKILIKLDDLCLACVEKMFIVINGMKK